MKMKKEIVTMLLAAALMTSSLTACTNVEADGNDIDNTTTESTTFEPPSETLDKELNIQDIPSTEEFINAIACNGVYYNSPIRYTIHSSGDLILYISEWNEFFVVPKREDMYLVAETVEASCAVLSENKCTIFFRDFSPDDKPISLIQFTRGNPEVTIHPLNLPDGDYSYGQKYCNFIDDKTGYLFLLGSSDITLRHLFKTTDGGETWVDQPVETSFSMNRKEDVICAKMLDENIGIIASRHYADDYSKRTFITTDAGKTWSSVDISYPNHSPNLGLGSESACDLQYENGKYILVYRFRCYKGNTFWSYVYLKYASKDLANLTFTGEYSTNLVNWTFYEE